jgi:hypothetical protein
MLCAFGIDVLDPRVSLRRVWVLAQRLPPWVRSMGEPWSAESDLLALVVDHLAQLAWITLRAAGAQAVTRPRPIPRPSGARLRAESRSASLSEPQGGKSSGWAGVAAQLATTPGVRVVKHGG